MTRTTIGILAGIALAAGVASRLDGGLGAGLFGGSLVGASMGLLGGALLRHTVRTQPTRTFHAFAIAFALKLFCLLLGVLSLRFLDPAASLADWKAFAIGYAGAAFLSLLLSAFEALRPLKGESSL